MAIERLGNTGYLALIKEATSGTPLTPTDYVPIYDAKIDTMGNFNDSNPVAGLLWDRLNVLRGQRSHKGSLTALWEPNTVARIIDMFAFKGTTTGPVSGVYTHPFTFTADSNTYTCDISSGNVVKRVFGVKASKLGFGFEDNEGRISVDLGGIGSFEGREIATVVTTTLTLKTDYDTAPNKGLVVGDLVRVYKSATGATLDTTIATVNVDGITITLGASAAAFAAGDFIFLRPSTATLNTNVFDPILWSETEFRFGTTAAAALSAAQTRVEPGSMFELMRPFKSDDGEKRSGGRDPGALLRKTFNATLKVGKAFDTPEDIALFNNLSGQACVIRAFSQSRLYETRMTFNKIITNGNIFPDLKADEYNYSELEYIASYNQTDGQAGDLKALNTYTTI